MSELLAPRENPHLFGHEEAESRFLAEWGRGIAHHAYLIRGPKGIGKATFAYRLARLILGEDAAGRIAAGSHTDLLTLEPAEGKDSITVDEARRLPQFLSLTSAEGAWRVVIVDAADELNNQAANALLKTLEEPPPRSIIFLISHRPGGLLPTIRSRCRNFSLLPPSREAFTKILQTVAPFIEPEKYDSLYELSYGSAGLAIMLAKHDGLKLYEGWLTAMQLAASEEDKSFADGIAAGKSLEAWSMLLHCWQVAMQQKVGIDPAMTQWHNAARQLLAATETYYLDKKATIRLMLEPDLLKQHFSGSA